MVICCSRGSLMLPWSLMVCSWCCGPWYSPASMVPDAVVPGCSLAAMGPGAHRLPWALVLTYRCHGPLMIPWFPEVDMVFWCCHGSLMLPRSSAAAIVLDATMVPPATMVPDIYSCWPPWSHCCLLLLATLTFTVLMFTVWLETHFWHLTFGFKLLSSHCIYSTTGLRLATQYDLTSADVAQDPLM